MIQRDEKEVFRPETIASFEGKAVTITHPTEFVSPQNWSQLAKGMLQNVRRGEGAQKDDLIADLLITDATAIFLVKSGLREVSCGYEAEYEQTGEGKGIQTNIIGNHLALVEQGRAGSAYAINDHKGKGNKMSFKDKVKAIFAKAQDEAMKMAEDEEKKPEEKKAQDDMGYGMDELVKMCKDLGEKVSSMAEKMGSKDAKEDMPEEKAKDDEIGAKEIEAKDDDQGLEDRLKTLEASVAKIMEAMSPKDEKADEEESKDAKEDEESEDDAENLMTGDTASRAEILSPGIEITKDVKAKALKAAYATKDGKIVIDSLSGGKPKFDSANVVDTLFIAASELLKAKRTKELAGTKHVRDSEKTDAGFMTAEKLNEINQKFYNKN
jgi:hypothetical protein